MSFLCQVENLSYQKIGLENINLTVNAGDIWAIVGVNGSGKSTFMRHCVGLIPPTAGRIVWDAHKTILIPHERRRYFSYLPQHITITDDITVSQMLEISVPHLSKTDRMNLLSEHKLQEKANTPLAHLSGGERTRIHLARCFATQSKTLWLDEPCASLDPFFILEFWKQIQDFTQKGGGAVLILHDLSLMRRFCTKILAISSGKVFCSGDVNFVFNNNYLDDVFNVRIDRSFSEITQATHFF